MIFMRRLETENTKKPNGFQAKRIETVTLALRDGGTPNVQQKQCGFILRVKVRLYYIFFPIYMYVYIYIWHIIEKKIYIYKYLCNMYGNQNIDVMYVYVCI